MECNEIAAKMRKKRRAAKPQPKELTTDYTDYTDGKDSEFPTPNSAIKSSV
jgi:hypothetical protein